MKKKEFQKYLDLYKNKVYSHAYYMLGVREDAEDVTQEAFVKLWNNLININQDKAGAWLIRVTHNLCMDMFRQRKNIGKQDLMDIQDVPEKEGSHYGFADPEFHVERKEIQEQLSRAMDRLPIKTKEILLLHYFQGFTLQMIGEMLDIPLNTVKVTVHRGRKTLRDLMVSSVNEDSIERTRVR